MLLPDIRGPLTVDDFHRLGELGVLGEDDRVELLDGRLVEMTPIGSRHAAVVARMAHLLEQRLGTQAIVWTQNPLAVGGHECYPDVALLIARPDFYARRIPGAHDTHLVVEVADSSLAHDREKLNRYATDAVPEVWVVDLNSDAIEVYRDPARERYATVRTAGLGETVAPLSFPDVPLSITEILA